MNTILTELGHRVDFVETGEAALRAVERGSYDAVLMDVMLPGFGGIEATQRIRALPGKAGTGAGDRHFRPRRNRRRRRRARRRYEFLFHQAGEPWAPGAGAGLNCEIASRRY